MEEDLSYCVPGVYLVRAEAEKIYAKLPAAGMKFCRRFLPYAVYSDFLVIFDPEMLASNFHAKTHEAESWVTHVKVEKKTEVTRTVQTVVAEESKARDSCRPEVQDEQVEEPLKPKKTRPSKNVRNALKAMSEKTKDQPEDRSKDEPEVKSGDKVEVETVVKTSSWRMVLPEKAKVPEGINITVSGIQLKPFKVSRTMMYAPRTKSGMMVVPHLNVMLPTEKPVANFARCKEWLGKVLVLLDRASVIQGTCEMKLFQPNERAGSPHNLSAIQLRFGDEVPMENRNAVYGILRSAVWFNSLVPGETGSASGELIKCFWRVVPEEE
jgi:hypothetical protein